jgi:hypothetical protein
MTTITKSTKENLALWRAVNKNAAFRFMHEQFGGARRYFDKYFEKMNRQNYAMHNSAGVLRGFALLDPNNRARSEVVLQLIGTDPRKGYGKVLMRRIQANAHARGIHTVIVHDPVREAQNFYRKLGATNEGLSNSNSPTMRLHAKRSPSRSRSPKSRKRL